MTISVRSLFHQTYFMIMKGNKTFNLILTAAGYFCMYFHETVHEKTVYSQKAN